MSWLFSQALAEEYSRATSWDGEPSAQLNVAPTARPFWRNDKPMDVSRLSRFGLTSRRLTAGHGAALLMWFRAGFPVRTSASPAPVPGSTGSTADCGFKWHESFVKYDPVTHSWKTRQLSLLGDSTGYSQTWPRWGVMRDGECWPLPTSALPTFERESGLLLPTPCTIDSGSFFNQSLSDDATLRPTLGAMACYGLWPAPGEPPLWPTPTVRGNYNRKGASPRSGEGLETAVRKFPTPTVAMRRGSSPGALTRKSGRSRETDRLDYAIEGEGNRGRLNPQWVEWLMGWPIGWTALPPLAMDRFHEWRQQHGGFYVPD